MSSEQTGRLGVFGIKEKVVAAANFGCAYSVLLRQKKHNYSSRSQVDIK